MFRRIPKWLLAIPVVAVALFVGGPWVYINFIKEDAPDRLTFAEAGGTTTSTGAGADDTPTSTAAGATTGEGVDGTWKVTSGSTAGYRVKEILNGQSTEAAGRTSDVSGAMEIAGTTVQSASIVVDLATVTSDESKRDSQFRGRIMNVAQYPTAEFKLGQPLGFGSLPADGATLTVPATGTLTLHGTTKTVTVDLQARRNAANIEVLGTIPVVFADYGIDNPSNMFVKAEDHGEIEFLVVFTQA